MYEETHTHTHTHTHTRTFAQVYMHSKGIAPSSADALCKHVRVMSVEELVPVHAAELLQNVVDLDVSDINSVMRPAPSSECDS